MHRRKFIAAAGTTAALTLAGCLGDDDAGDDPESTVVTWYERVDELDQEATGDEVEETLDDLLHSESPIRAGFELIDEEDIEETDEQETELEDVETEILDEDIGADEIQTEFEVLTEEEAKEAGFGLDFAVSEETLEEVGEENALVEATVTTDEGDEEQEEWLVTTEDGDWVIFL